MSSETKSLTTGTPYDDAYRTMIVDCIRLVIPVVNEVFGKHYSGDEEVIARPNERFLTQQDSEEKRITDGTFTIRGEVDETYLFECQSTPDSNMLIRIWEYIVQIGVERGSVLASRMVIRIPQAAVLYLRSTESTPDTMEIVVEASTGSLAFPVRVMKMRNYTLDAIFDKKLFFLLPFYIFTHESEFERHKEDDRWLEALRTEYFEMLKRLDEAVEQNQLSFYYRRTIIDMTKKVLESITAKYDRIREGVSSVMGGQVLEHEAKTIFREGKLEGRAEGRQEGRQEEREAISVKLYNIGMPVEQIAEVAGVSVNIVRQWIAAHTA